MRRCIPIRTIGLHEQMAFLRMCCPTLRCYIEKRANGSFLVCRGEVQPTPVNKRYFVRIEYRTRKRPRVWVESPKLLRRRTDERIPHTFSDDRPCLFRCEFCSDMLIARTIVPWLEMWLFFYEIWYATGQWLGGGAHPGEDADEQLTEVTQR